MLTFRADSGQTQFRSHKKRRKLTGVNPILCTTATPLSVGDPMLASIDAIGLYLFLELSFDAAGT
jgi:hypothetical protein